MQKKTILLGLWMVALAHAQDRAALRRAEDTCGPRNAKFQVNGDRSQHPAGPPDEGKARVYFLGDASYGIDGQWVGSVKRTYSSIEVDPGLHHVCARYSHWNSIYLEIIWVKITRFSLHSLDAKAGETYYFDGDFTGRGWFDFGLLQLDPDEGARKVAATKYSTYRRK